MRLYQFLKDKYNLLKSEVESFNIDHNVRVNGYEKWLSYILKPDDKVYVDNKLVEVITNKKIYIEFYKPRGVICTNDRKASNNIRDYLNFPYRIYSIGRLDKESEGLLLLTNDGQFFNRLLDEDNHVEKEYIVKVDKKIDQDFVNKMSNGVPVLDKITKKCEVTLIDDYTFKIVLTQGMNKQIRRMCKYFDYQVIFLKRIRIGKLNLDVEDGKYREIEINEVID